MWRKRKSKSKFSGNWTKIYWAIPALFVIALVFIFFKSGLFTVTQVEIDSDHLNCADETQIRNSLNLSGRNFFLVNSERVANDLKAKFICIENINVSLVSPTKVKLAARGRQAVATIMSFKNLEATSASFLEAVATPSAEQSQDFYLVDQEGVIFSKDTEGLNIPDIFIKDTNISLGKKLGENIKNTLRILAKVKTFGIDVKTTAILDDFFIIFSHPRIVFRLNDKIDMQLASLQLILAEAKIDFKELEFIDLRFDKPIVRFAPKNNGQR